MLGVFLGALSRCPEASSLLRLSLKGATCLLTLNDLTQKRNVTGYNVSHFTPKMWWIIIQLHIIIKSKSREHCADNVPLSLEIINAHWNQFECRTFTVLIIGLLMVSLQLETNQWVRNIEIHCGSWGGGGGRAACVPQLNGPQTDV